MKIIGWDIGERHLAYALIEFADEWKIIAAETVDFIGDSNGVSYTRNPAKYLEKFRKKLEEVADGFAAHSPEYVIIEKQPPLSSRTTRYVMHVLMNCLIFYYVSKNVDSGKIFLMDSREKFAIDPMIGAYPRGGENYSTRKKLSVSLAKNCLMKSRLNKKYLEKLETGKGQQHDWCDALTMCLYFCNYSLS